MADLSTRTAFTGTKLKVRTHTRNTAPEIANNGLASQSSDIWALGCIVSFPGPPTTGDLGPNTDLFKFWQIWTGTEFMGPIAWDQLLKVKIFAGLSTPHCRRHPPSREG